jgi:hypothetical protein
MEPSAEKMTAVTEHIRSAALLYNRGKFLDVIDLLSDPETETAKKYDIDILHNVVKIPVESAADIGNPDYLFTVITGILLNSHGPLEDRLELADVVAVVNHKDLPDETIPQLWRKVQALSFLEEWVHVLINTDEAAGGIDHTDPEYDFGKSEIEVAKHLHGLGIKLPKYFLENYERPSLGIPVEDHDFDSVNVG